MEYVKITVIIPCYNVERFIERTVSFLDAQTYRNFEVILIDDGSTDGTWSILKEIVDKHKEYHAYKYLNAGLSEARNRGLEYATGDYVYFLDADDYFLPDMFGRVVSVIEDYEKPDIIRFGYKWYYGDIGDIKEEQLEFEQRKITDDGILRLACDVIGNSESELRDFFMTGVWKWKNSGFPVWCHMYNSHFLNSNNLRFVKGLKMVEDRIFNATCLAYAKEVVLMEKVFYYYLSQPNGLLGRIKKNIKGLYGDKIMAVEQREMIRRLFKERKDFDISPYYQGSTIAAVLQLAFSFSKVGFFEGFKYYNNYVNQNLVKECLDNFKLTGTPLKFRVPLLLVKNRMGGDFT